MASSSPGGMAEAIGLPIPVIPLELPSYQRKENFGADETFFQIVRALAKPRDRSDRITCNLIGPTALGFRHRDDITELAGLLMEMGIGVNVVAPYDATPEDITRLGAAHFNVLMYPETGEAACRWMERALGQPFTNIEITGETTLKAGAAAPVSMVARHAADSGYDVLPSNSDLTAAEVELIEVEHKERRLRAALIEASDTYDYMLIDCPPSLNMLTLNALVAADGVIITMQCEYFALEGLSALVEQVLEETALDSRLFGLEITESTIMKNIDSAVATLNILKSMGIHLSIDDFGTGYSSLSYLKQFPVDQLKIDQSFVRNVTSESDDAAISMAIIAMAHSMKLSVIAEGVENQEQADFLTARGCNEMQGYHFSRPMPHGEMASVLKQVAVV